MITRLGKFEILRSLGQGAMGEVYLARDPAIGREVAVKTILASSTAGEGAKDRFTREAKAAGTLNHPGIVTIHEFGEDQGVLYLAMEYVEGEDLHDLLAQRALTKTDLLEVLAQVGEALAFAHRKGVLHRDVKPSNIRVAREAGRLQAKLMDFGIARMSESTLTSAGMLMGTVAYMAPEYVKTGQADPRGDLFAVGAMLYEGLSGQLPFAGDTTATILYRLVHEPPKPLPPSALVGASPALRGILSRALDKDPERRYATGDELAQALRAAKDPNWMGGGTPTVETVRPLEVVPKSRKGILAAAILVGAVGVGVVAWRRHRSVPSPSLAMTTASLPAPIQTSPAPAPPPASDPPQATEVPLVKPEEKRGPKATPIPLKQEPAPAAPPPVQEEDPIPPEAPSDPVSTQPNALAAAGEIDRDPAQAHRDLSALISQHPENSHLRALDLVALAKASDGAGFVKAWDASLAAGVNPRSLLFTPRFATLVKEQRANQSLPPEALDRLKQAYGNQEAPRRRFGRWRN